MPTNESLPLLSFIYDVYTDPKIQDAFKQDPEKTMDGYKLTWEQKIAIYHSGANPMFLTAKEVPGYPKFINPAAISNDEAKNSPNPVTADWWASYARFKADVDLGNPTQPVPNPRGVNDRPEGDRVSMAGVMTLLGEELSRKAVWRTPW